MKIVSGTRFLPGGAWGKSKNRPSAFSLPRDGKNPRYHPASVPCAGLHFPAHVLPCAASGLTPAGQTAAPLFAGNSHTEPSEDSPAGRFQPRRPFSGADTVPLLTYVHRPDVLYPIVADLSRGSFDFSGNGVGDLRCPAGRAPGVVRSELPSTVSFRGARSRRDRLDLPSRNFVAPSPRPPFPGGEGGQKVYVRLE